MKVCYFGTYERQYPRNKIFIDGLRSSGVEVIECHISLWEENEHKTKQFNNVFNKINLLLRIIASSIKLIFKYFSTKSYIATIIIVGYPGHFDIIPAFILTRIFRQKLVFNPLISFYDTVINDRKLFKPNSFVSFLLLRYEKFIFNLCSLIITDTQANSAYFNKTFNIPLSRIIRIFVGADEDIFYYSPYRNNPKKIEIIFLGKLTPLHGVPTILKAAKLLDKGENIHFTVIGTGQLSEEVLRLSKELTLKNVTFIKWVPYAKIEHFLSKSDISLGIFDAGDKADRVIPNKIFQALCVGRVVITRRSKAISELFEDGKNILLCKQESPTSLSRAILKAKNNPYLRARIAKSGNLLFQERLTVDNLGAELKEALIINSEMHNSAKNNQ